MAQRVMIVQNFTITVIDTEQSFNIPSNAIDWSIRLRNPSHSVKIAVVNGRSDTEYFTLDSTMPSFGAEDVHSRARTLYVQSSDTNPVLEIVAFC